MSTTYASPANATCPLPFTDYPSVTLAHGGGGRFSKMLVEELFYAAFGNPTLGVFHDGAQITLNGGRIAMSTDSYVINPIFFPGGNIGSLSVHGTINDLAMCGARPLCLSSAFILEEGFAMADLWRIATSMRDAAAGVGVPIVTGDTKVVDRGKADGIFINTTGMGVVPDNVEIAPTRARPGDVILVSGEIATHGVAIMSVREGLEFETTLESDSAALDGLAFELLDALGRDVHELLDALGRDVHVLRDPTRGGVASSVNEIAASARVGMRLDESKFPILEDVRGACEILGLDPLYVANEGKMLAFVARDRAEEALELLRAHPLGRKAAIVGEVVDEHPGRVLMKSAIGGLRVVEMLSGEQLPRIC
jgi:hydrogenase expression/formation protein HypE